VTLAVVAGAVASKAGNGGAAWTRLSWARALEHLGFDVHLVEQLRGEPAAGAEQWFAEAVTAAGLGARSTLLRADGTTAWGLTAAELGDLAAGAAVLFNISGHLTLPEVCGRVGATVFVDLDPGYTQVWDAEGTAPLARHDHWFTVGQLLGTAACPVPDGGRRWCSVRQPVVLEDWPVAPVAPTEPARFTTVSAWRGPYGPVEVGGRPLGPKAHEFRRFIDLPRLAAATFELALEIDEADGKDRDALEEHGWRLADPAEAAWDTARFRRYVQESAAEFSVAQGVYVHGRTGWFSDRTTRYLASGRPAVVQDTGFSQTLPCGAGLLAFDSPRGAAAAVEAVLADYDCHARIARALAEELFSPVRALSPMLEEIDVAP
jgi:hypothetical protein